MSAEPRNLAELFEWQCDRLGPGVALRDKRLGLYRDMTWSSYREQVIACASALIAAGVQVGDRVGILSENRREWLIADMAILACGAINVPPHAPLPAAQVQFQFSDTQTSWLFVSNQNQLDKICSVRQDLPHLRGVVLFEGWADDALSWVGFLQNGRSSNQRNELTARCQSLGMDDLATIMYTSGTTGNPKGVMLTHGNLMSNAAASDLASPRNHGVILNWLPFSHIYARTVDHYLSIAAGVTLCLAESHETVVRNLAETHPTHFASVPRFYEKVLASVRDPDPKITGQRLRDVFGPRIDWLNSGGAPCPVGVAKAYHDAGLLLLQGYGLTESAPVISFNCPRAYKIETVGRPIPGIEVQIADDGEILTRGPHVMKGYWNNPAATAETIQDGWLCTGDLGSLDSDGFLSITGRKKDLMVLSNGKKVIPTQVEGLLIGSGCVDQAIVLGEGKNFLTALIVPNWKAVGKECEILLKTRIDECLKDLAPWEQVKRFEIANPFSVEAGELTVSLKMRRGVICEHYREQIAEMYRGCSPE